MKTYLNLLLLSVIASGFVGCASTNCDTCDGRSMTPRHAGHAGYDAVQVYHSNPAKAYQILGEVVVTTEADAPKEKTYQMLKEKAAHRGADAVIVTKKIVDEQNNTKTVRGNAIVWETKQHD